ncbi:MAG: hypothetical protein Cons2KO_13270 [Congregibacter sp.]
MSSLLPSADRTLTCKPLSAGVIAVPETSSARRESSAALVAEIADVIAAANDSKQQQIALSIEHLDGA